MKNQSDDYSSPQDIILGITLAVLAGAAIWAIVLWFLLGGS